MPDDSRPQLRSGATLPDSCEAPPDAAHTTQFDIDALMQAALKRKPTVPHLAEITQYLIEEWGGPRRFARAFRTEYAATQSSLIRARMLECVLRLLQTHANLMGPSEELGMISEDDLKAAAVSLLANATQTARPDTRSEATASVEAEAQDP